MSYQSVKVVSCQGVPQLCPVENVTSVPFLPKRTCRHSGSRVSFYIYIYIQYMVFQCFSYVFPKAMRETRGGGKNHGAITSEKMVEAGKDQPCPSRMMAGACTTSSRFSWWALLQINFVVLQFWKFKIEIDRGLHKI